MIGLLGAVAILAAAAGNQAAADSLDRAAGILPLLPEVEPAPDASQEEKRGQEAWRKWDGRQVQPAPPVLDFSRIELEPVVGLAFYSGDFDADPETAGGVIVRIPAPGLLFLLPELGVFAEFVATRMERDPLPTRPIRDDGVWFAAVGFDYPYNLSEELIVAGQVGAMYGDFGDISDTANGIAFLAGGRLGFQVSKGIEFNVHAQLAYASVMDDFIGFLFAGIGIKF